MPTDPPRATSSVVLPSKDLALPLLDDVRRLVRNELAAGRARRGHHGVAEGHGFEVRTPPSSPNLAPVPHGRDIGGRRGGFEGSRAGSGRFVCLHHAPTTQWLRKPRTAPSRKM